MAREPRHILSLYEVDESVKFVNRSNIAVSFAKISREASGEAIISAAKNFLLAIRAKTRSETAKPSHAPRDHVSIRQAHPSRADIAEAKRLRGLASSLYFARAKASAVGTVIIRNSPSTFGFSKVETARPRI